MVGEYLFDCENFRTDDKDDLLRQVYEMTDRRFQLADHLLRRSRGSSSRWSRWAQTGCTTAWYMDPEHHQHEPRNQYENAILDYHVHVDGLLGGLIEHADDDTAILVVSDHGAKRMDGGIRVDEWPPWEGLLATKTEPNGTSKVHDVGIDWSRTVAWGEGGYYSRIFMNVKGREPSVVEPSEYESVRDDLARRLAAIPDENGNPIPTVVHKPEDVYDQVSGVAPDLIVHFGDLLWRSVGTVGGPDGVHTFENDTGPDDANHAQEGLFVLVAPGVGQGARTRTCSTSRRPCSSHRARAARGRRGRSLLSGA